VIAWFSDLVKPTPIVKILIVSAFLSSCNTIHQERKKVQHVEEKQYPSESYDVAMYRYPNGNTGSLQFDRETGKRGTEIKSN